MIRQVIVLSRGLMMKQMMGMSQLNKKYTKDHEWILVDENKNEAQIGITNYASNQLGQIVFIEMPE